LELQYHLQAGDLDVIKKWADERVFDFSDVQYNEEMYILYARYLVKARESKKAVEICQHLIDHYKATGSEIGLASVLGDQAVAYMQSGMKAEALKNIARMMEFNQIEGAAVPILRKGPVMLELLKIALQRGIQSERIRKLLDEIQKKFPEHDRSKKEGGGRYLTEHLTGREIEILKMLDSGRSSTEIARQLVVAVSTVRTHIKNIYNKLGVGHRIEAVRKARELHII
jgi:LuxR family maltose regulon positive regulatory protein